MNTSKRMVTFHVDHWDTSDPLPSAITRSADDSTPGELRLLEYFIDDHSIQLTPNGEDFVLMVTSPTGEPLPLYSGSRLPHRCDFRIQLEHSTIRFFDSGPEQVNHSYAPSASASFAMLTPENVAMIVSLLGVAIGATTVILKGIEAWLSQKANRKLRIRYKDFEVEISGSLSEEDIKRRIAIFDHLSESLDKRFIDIEKVAE